MRPHGPRPALGSPGLSVQHPVDRRSERRQLTILFCDMVDSTGLSQRCDPEDVQEVLFEFQTLSTRCVESWGGQVINYRGDGILAQFGYPLTSEHEAENDDASREKQPLKLIGAMSTVRPASKPASFGMYCRAIGLRLEVGMSAG